MEPKAYKCKDAKRDINFFFKHAGIKISKKAEDALNRAIEHMTQGTTVGHHNISCHPCWDYHMEMKRKYCGG